jgi:hypothetical protein
MTSSSNRPWGAAWSCLMASFLALALIPSAKAVDPSEPVSVVLDQAQLLRLPDHVATIVIGNPLIADVTIQAGGMMVVTGKGYGITNIIALDRTGKVLMDRPVQVEGPVDVVVVYRGVNRESYSCTPNCERRITLGDTPEFFDTTMGQTVNRNGRAQGSGGGSGGAPAGR